MGKAKRNASFLLSYMIAFAIVMAICSNAEAKTFKKRFQRYRPANTVQKVSEKKTFQYNYSSETFHASSREMVVWDLFNNLRAERGLNRLAWNQNAYEICRKNNEQQKKHGLGHFVSKGRQNAAIGNYKENGARSFYQWLHSAPHLQNFLGKGITSGAVAISDTAATWEGWK